MKVEKSIIVWALWIFAVLCFAFAAYVAPDANPDDQLPITAPEFFLFWLGMFHMVAGAVLLIETFLKENDLV